MEVTFPTATETGGEQAPPRACPFASLLSQLEGSKEDQADDAAPADLAELRLTLGKRRLWILKFTAGVTLLAVIVVWLLPNTYTATATILPPQSSQASLASLLGQFGPAVTLGAKEIGLKNPADLYVGMLRTRGVADALITRFQLREVYHQKKYFDARKTLAARTDIVAGKEGTISISVSDRDAKRSAVLANGYVEELQNLTHRLALTEAGQRRVFFQKQLDDEKQALSAAELALKTTQERTGLIQLDAQGKAIITAVGETLAQIAMDEVALRTMSSSATPQNPEFVRQKEELAGLRQQLAKLEHSSGAEHDDIQVPTGKVPQAELEYLRCLRDLKYHETLFEFLSKQFEAARLDEAKDSVVVQVVDAAVEPERKSGPMRLAIVALLTAISFLGAISWALMGDRIKEKFRNPEVSPNVPECREEVGF